MVPFDRSRTSSYSSSIVTMVVSCAVFESEILDERQLIIIINGLKWDGMGRYGIPLSQSLSHDNTVCERRKERLGNVPFCIWLEV